ncbi:MAG: ABC transporter substrate-binding protein [Bdellovibrionales bacterium]|nr:ABC transporter substrate-binding protein [Bdellovibrionales bacterium]
MFKRKKPFFFFTLYLVMATTFAVANNETLTPVRIGWQIPWATQGQIVQIWKRTDILKKNGLNAEFIGRTYGPLLNELAIAGTVDVILTADQPAAVLFAKSTDWMGIARLMYNRTLVYVPSKSPIKTLKELKGKRIGVPIGAAAERVMVAAMKRNGLDPLKDIKVVNVGIREQIPIVASGKNESSWGNLDALSGFDPTPAIFESQKLVRVLDVGKVVSLVLVRKSYSVEHKNVSQRIAQSLYDAYDFYRTNKTQANKWFIQEAKLRDANNETCNIAASIEPNLSAIKRSDIRITLDPEDFQVLQEAADFVAPIVKKTIRMTDFVTNRFSNQSH